MATDADRKRLEEAAETAVEAMKAAWAKKPQLGTPERKEFEELQRQAVEAYNAYARVAGRSLVN